MFNVIGGVRGVIHVQCDGGGVSVIFKVMAEGRQPCSR